MEIKIDVEYRNDRLKELREKNGITQKQLADLTGINIRAIRSYEQGTRNLNGARLSTLLKFCIALGCPLHDLITEPETLENLERIKTT